MLETSERMRVAFEQLDADSMKEIDGLMRTKKCQIKRIDGLLTRVSAALDQWVDSYSKYWAAWSNSEQERVEGLLKSQASIEAEQQRALDFLESVKKDRESLLRDKANLEKFPNRTAEIQKRIDELIKDLIDSETRLNDAQKNYDDVSIRVKSMGASINAKLIDIRQNQRRVEAFGVQMKADYEITRDAANQICSAAPPDTLRTPLPKKKTADPPGAAPVKP
jgi:chromosome segregation ATPase